MKQAIKALSLATKILWILVIIFSITAVYSVANLRIGFGEQKTSFSGDSITLSTPLFINNTGFYEIADMNITIQIRDRDNKTVSTSTTIVPSISPNINIQKTHNITLNLKNLTRELPYLTFSDSIFDIRTFVALRFANVIPVQMSMNTTMPWGAPLYNFFIGEISLDYAKKRLIVPLSFENRAFFGIDGIMRLEVFNSENGCVNSVEVAIEVHAGSGFEDFVEVNVDPSKLTHENQVRIFIETSMLNVGPIVKGWMT